MSLKPICLLSNTYMGPNGWQTFLNFFRLSFSINRYVIWTVFSNLNYTTQSQDKTCDVGIESLTDVKLNFSMKSNMVEWYVIGSVSTKLNQFIGLLSCKNNLQTQFTVLEILNINL